LARHLAQNAAPFKGLTELEKTTISNRSIKLFTLSAIYQATGALLDKRKNDPINDEEKDLALRFWNELVKVITEWQLVIKHEVSSGELRQDYVHVHAVTLHALGIAGHALLETHPDDWSQQLQHLRQIDWSRSNVEVWEGRTMSGGHMSKSRRNVQATAAFLKKNLGLTLTSAEQQAEEHFVSVRQETVSTQG
jgi:DNA sulfur modification protein DndB